MRRLSLALLAATSLAACTVNSGLETTPTFAPARYVPEVVAVPPAPPPDPAPSRHRRSRHDGAAIVAEATRRATVDPDESTMQGATWVIDDVQPSAIYRVRTALNRVTTILLPPGERFNGAVGGDVEHFLINVAYAGPRPAVSILPRTREAKGNLQLVTTGGFYSFDLLVNEQVAVNLVDVMRAGDGPRTVPSALPQPEGDFTRLASVAEGGPLPAWAPAEAWADSTKMVVRFNGPLPTLPALFAGHQGEQLVSYRSEREGQQVYLITSRRVTEAELRLGSERLRLTVDPDAVRSGTAADPAQGAGGWRPAQALEAPAPSPMVLLVQPPAPSALASAAAPSLPPAAGQGGASQAIPAGTQHAAAFASPGRDHPTSAGHGGPPADGRPPAREALSHGVRQRLRSQGLAAAATRPAAGPALPAAHDRAGRAAGGRHPVRALAVQLALRGDGSTPHRDPADPGRGAGVPAARARGRARLHSLDPEGPARRPSPPGTGPAGTGP